MEKRFELVSSDKNKTVCVLFLFILLLIEIDLILKKKRNKKNLFWVFSFGGGKIIFKLLTKVVAFYMEFITIYV